MKPKFYVGVVFLTLLVGFGIGSAVLLSGTDTFTCFRVHKRWTRSRLQFDTTITVDATQKPYGPISIYERAFRP
jgi:hypothetical protein